VVVEITSDGETMADTMDEWRSPRAGVRTSGKSGGYIVATSEASR